MKKFAIGAPQRCRGGRSWQAFPFNAAAISVMLAVAPLTSGGGVPQNLVFFTSRPEYYYVVVAVSALALSPALVLWTGLCAAIGLAGATAWIRARMDSAVGLGDLPPTPSPEDYLAIVLNPDFLGVGFRVNQAVVVALVTCIAALAVHRARNVVRAHAAAEAERTRIHRIFGRYVPAQVVEQLIGAGQLAPQQREASILFADIEGFTRLSELLPPARVIGLLNSFFSAATAAIDQRGGVVVNHVGDALIAALTRLFPSRCMLSGRWRLPAPCCLSFPSAISTAIGFACGSASLQVWSQPAQWVARGARHIRSMTIP